ncbi:alpha/beta fold hydrolase [Croceivirga radicis]|uniref:alpha/beta fold hydrolase n=1 Tax=Croceivirga radicis TaxID=1929488 RepID=UPI000255B2DA|nr:alpha/beta hydrolase [Croceivirga radicis]
MLNYNTYIKSNNTPWVTFVHGAGGSSTIWYKQIKDFKKHFNVLLIDLRGHGRSKFHLTEAFKEKYTFEVITDDILEVLDHLKIQKSHFVGISLGTILIRNIAEKQPQRIDKMVMGGAVMKLNFRSQFLMKMGVLLKSVVPYIWLYKFFAFVIMPNKNHKESRNLFVKEAKKLYQKEFIRWFKLTSEVNPLLKWFRTVDVNLPTFYVMGEEDYLFLPAVKKMVAQHKQTKLEVFQETGHVVNIERPEKFNQVVLAYLTT